MFQSTLVLSSPTSNSLKQSGNAPERNTIPVSESRLLFKYLEEPSLLEYRNAQVNSFVMGHQSLPSTSIKINLMWLTSAVFKLIPKL